MAKMVATTHRRRGGVIVKSVEPDSTADLCGIEVGDKIWSINGNIIPDSLSFTFNIAMPMLKITLIKPDGETWELDVENDGEAFGAQLEEDPIMLCRNKCVFCFVDQNPKGYRRSLLIKDEDIRLSFMYGNYTTLSSTDTAEEERIIREKISPLYVSVHATDPETRIFMLKNKRSGNILERLKRFAEAGIDFHAQIVLCPDLNDGEILARTIEELTQLYPHCLSIAVVPLGITSHRANLTRLTPVTDEYCLQTIQFCEPFHDRFQESLGYPMVFLGDEFYIRARVPIPDADYYSDFPQMENGIGMVRRFIDEFKEEMFRWNLTTGMRGTLVTGTLFGTILEQCIQELNRERGTDLRVVAVDNEAFGADLINVAGLVHGEDIFKQLEGRDLGDFVMIPHVMLKDPEDDPILIDNVHPATLSRKLGVPIVLTGNTAEELLDVLADWQSHIVTPSAA